MSHSIWWYVYGPPIIIIWLSLPMLDKSPVTQFQTHVKLGVFDPWVIAFDDVYMVNLMILSSLLLMLEKSLLSHNGRNTWTWVIAFDDAYIVHLIVLQFVCGPWLMQFVTRQSMSHSTRWCVYGSPKNNTSHNAYVVRESCGLWLHYPWLISRHNVYMVHLIILRHTMRV